MIIVLEGNECTFKSTLAKKLRELRPEYEVVKGSTFESALGTQEELYRFYTKIMEKSMSQTVILDRFFISNLVYATLYPSYTKLRSDEVKEIVEFMKNHGYRLIWCQDSAENIHRRLHERGDEYIESIAEVERINKMYATVFNKIHKMDLLYVAFDCRFNKVGDLLPIL